MGEKQITEIHLEWGTGTCEELEGVSEFKYLEFMVQELVPENQGT